MSRNTPLFVTRLFWEYALDAIDLMRHKQFVIERILEKGNFDAVRWVFKTYSLEDIQTVLSSSNLSAPTRQMWRTYFATIA